MILRHSVKIATIAALVMVLSAGASPAAASGKPRPSVLSTNPLDGAIDVPVETSITVNFSLPMDCKSINKNTFWLKTVMGGHIVPGSITCGGNSATFAPSIALKINSRYRLNITGAVKAFNGKTLRDAFESYFTTGSSSPTPTATATSTATRLPAQPRQILRPQRQRQPRPPLPLRLRRRPRPQLRLRRP